MVEALKKNELWEGREGPLVLMILDGIGYGKYKEGDAIADTRTHWLDFFMTKYPEMCDVGYNLKTELKAHGTAVGLPSDDDMGNSEVGHNAMGAGRVFAQGAKLVSNAIASKDMFAGDVWKKLVKNANDNDSTLHFLGLFSDGNVHSHIDHLKAMILQAQEEGVKKIRIHTLIDGRDVGETSALEYIDPFEEFLNAINAKGFDYRIASGGGRMKMTMDRYNANWAMVDLGWKTHVKGEGRMFKSANDAICTLRKETGAIDQDLDAFIISDDGKTPIGPVVDNDSLIFFNFRGDRSLEITAAFEQDEMDKFDRGPKPNIEYAGMMEYDGDLKAPKQYLVNPPLIDKTLSEYLCATGLKQLAVSETQKFGHVTYFFNGNKSGYFNEDLENYVEIPSDICPFEEKPEMKSKEITDVIVEAIHNYYYEDKRYDFIRVNYPNGDMVGHTGNYEAVKKSILALDSSLDRVINAIGAMNGTLIITADHGNADDMFEHQKNGDVKMKDGKPVRKTSHSLNPVPFIIYDAGTRLEYDDKLKEGMGLSSIPATVINLLGYLPPEEYDDSLITFINYN